MNKNCFKYLSDKINDFSKYDEDYMIQCDLEAIELGLFKGEDLK